MPPKKDALSRFALRDVIRKHGIQFKGPVPPTKWPEEHKHQFEVIRNIETIRYDQYKANQEVPKDRRDDFRERVRFIRKRVYWLLDNATANESTWRDLELYILKRFEEDVLCGRCNNEVWKSDYEADFRSLEDQVKLDGKRRLRQVCDCKNKLLYMPAENNDDENRDLFAFVKETPITHTSGDDLENLSISMKPDRVIGLRPPSRIPYDYSYFPIIGQRILLPFLVVEAKRENDAPGFRAIQYQTAFPIRRFLKAQLELGLREQSSEPCLVWFFGYQGDQWRLYAATQTKDKVNIYDLWQGTIQSQDGALQLLLIVDYIWSWARDIYRPTIRSLLLGSLTNSGDLSPASTDRFRQSVSLSCAPSPAPTMHDPDSMDTDEVGAAADSAGARFNMASQGFQHSQEREEIRTLLDAGSHSFLRWAFGHSSAPPWTSLGSIRHSNIVHFEFRCHAIWRQQNHQLESIDPDYHLICDLEPYWAFRILPEQLQNLAALWTMKSILFPVLEHGKAIRAGLYFHTYFDPSSWQIRRVLSCILWLAEPLTLTTQVNVERTTDQSQGHVAGDHLPASFEMRDFERAILEVRQIRGRDSVWAALQCASMALVSSTGSNTLSWISFLTLELIEEKSRIVLSLPEHKEIGDIVVHCINRCDGLSQVSEEFRGQLRSPNLDIGRDMRIGDSMLMIRSPAWPEACPMFCLFILPDAVDHSESYLSQLLEEAVSLRHFYGVGDYRLSMAEWKILFRWRRALQAMA